MIEIWSDIHHEIIHDAKGGLKKVINVEAVETSVYNILGTRKGERVMLPEFGANLGSEVFELIDRGISRDISDKLKREIEYWDDRVEVVGVDYEAQPDFNFLKIGIRFRIRGYDREFKTSFNIGG